jgi:hypothetical protein
VLPIGGALTGRISYFFFPLPDLILMATGTVRPSPNEAPGTMVFPKPNGSLHQLEKSIVGSLRSSPRSSNPFIITERQDEKQLCIQSRTLRVTDFVLIKTLGTGTDILLLVFSLRE